MSIFVLKRLCQNPIFDSFYVKNNSENSCLMRIYHVLTIVLLCVLMTSRSEGNNKISYRIKNVLAKQPEMQNISVWIYFSDKGDENEIANAYRNINLPQNSIKRRLKTFNSQKSLTTWYDIPVNDSYIAKVQPFVLSVRKKSKWLNAVSAEISVESLSKISRLPFVKKIDLLAKGKIKKENYNNVSKALLHQSSTSQREHNYGLSYTQNQLIRVPELHALGLSGNNVIVCMMDAGYNNLAHSSLQHIILLGTWDFVNNDANVGDEDDFGTGVHGTLTLSALGGYKSDTLIGPAYGAKFVLTKTENTESETQVEEDNWIAAVEWAEANFGPDITSTSLGYIDFDNGFAYTPDDLDGNTAAITIAADIAASLGILVINSAGNAGPGPTTLGAPADGDSVLAVGATYSSGEIAEFSSRGPTADGRVKPEVCAQGVYVLSASPYGEGFVYANGTSLSCPMVAGAAALLIEAFPQAPNMEIFEALKVTANKSYEPDNAYGWGIINAWATYNYLSGKPHISHEPITEAYDLDEGYNVECKVFAKNGDIDIIKVVYRVNNGTWQNLLMSNVEEHSFMAQIPQANGLDVVDYYIYAENSTGTYTFPENAPTNFVSFVITNINELIETKDVFVTPNPVNTKFTIKGIDLIPIDKIEIFNSLGQPVLQKQDYLQWEEFDVSDLVSGSYFLKIESNQKTKILKFIKTN